jgi:hypothetical protein
MMEAQSIRTQQRLEIGTLSHRTWLSLRPHRAHTRRIHLPLSLRTPPCRMKLPVSLLTRYWCSLRSSVPNRPVVIPDRSLESTICQDDGPKHSPNKERRWTPVSSRGEDANYFTSWIRCAEHASSNSPRKDTYNVFLTRLDNGTFCLRGADYIPIYTRCLNSMPQD